MGVTTWRSLGRLGLWAITRRMSTTQPAVELPSTSSGAQQRVDGAPDMAQNQATNANMVMFPLMMGSPWCQKFNGDQMPQGNNFQDWYNMQTSMFNIYPFSEVQKVSAVISNLDGEAKREVLALPAAQRMTAEQILSFLKSIYGDTVPLATLRAQFFTRKQRTDENVRQFALALQELSNRLDNRGDGTIMGNVLRDQFILGLCDAGLRRELRGMVRGAPDSSFIEVKKEAILRAEEFGEVRQAVAATVQLKPAPDATKLVEEIKQEVVLQLKGEIKEMVAGMIKEVREGVQHLLPSSDNARPRYELRRGRRSSDQFDQQGRPICRRCKQAGHIERRCGAVEGGQGPLNF